METIMYWTQQSTQPKDIVGHGLQSLFLLYVSPKPPDESSRQVWEIYVVRQMHNATDADIYTPLGISLSKTLIEFKIAVFALSRAQAHLKFLFLL